MTNSIAKQKRNPVAKKTDAVSNGRVYLSCRSAHGFISDRAPNGEGSSCYFEEYELGIGPWKATIVKTLDYGAGRTRFRAQYEVAPYRRNGLTQALRRWRRRPSTNGS